MQSESETTIRNGIHRTEEEIKALNDWIAWRGQESDRLYERYGKALEAEHTGEFAAISDAGEVVFGTDQVTVTMRACERFGAGQYAFCRIGSNYVGRIRDLRR